MHIEKKIGCFFSALNRVRCCLYGSEQWGLHILLTESFLSCLYGSERSVSRPEPHQAFLSCLYGSELTISVINELNSFSKLPVRQ